MHINTALSQCLTITEEKCATCTGDIITHLSQEVKKATTKKQHLSTSKCTSTLHSHRVSSSRKESAQNMSTPTRPLRTVACETYWIQSWHSRPASGFCAHFTEREICLNLASTGWPRGPSHSKSDSWHNSCFLIPSKPIKIPVSMRHQKHHISLWWHSSAQWFLVPAGPLNEQFLEVFSLVVNRCSKLNRPLKKWYQDWACPFACALQRATSWSRHATDTFAKT